MKKVLSILFFFAATNMPAQQIDSTNGKVSSKLNLIRHVRSLLVDSLKLKVGEKFYTEFASSDSVISYLYISKKDSVKKMTDGDFISFGNHPSAAKDKADDMERKGFDAMAYFTAGSSGAMINKRLLEYDSLSLTFILIHEAIHRHKNNSKAKFPYEFEEALGDVIANSFCGWYSGASVKDYFAFAFRNEEIYRVINRCIDGKLSKEKCEAKIKKRLKYATLFQKDRFDYKVNNAFLLRYSSYSKRYFQLREVYQRMKNPKLFIEEMMKLPADAKGCDSALVILKKKY
ncbi:MAG: hypothetical protein ACHQK8_03745 [Bacteroidia bacterium]